MGKRSLPTRRTTASSSNEPTVSLVLRRGKGSKSRGGGVSSTASTAAEVASAQSESKQQSRSPSNVDNGNDANEKVTASFKIPSLVNSKRGQQQDESMNDVTSSTGHVQGRHIPPLKNNSKKRKHNHNSLVAFIDGKEKTVKIKIGNYDLGSISSSSDGGGDSLGVEDDDGRARNSTTDAKKDGNQLQEKKTPKPKTVTSNSNDASTISNTKTNDVNNSIATPRRGTRVLPLRGSRMQSTQPPLQNKISNNKVEQSVAKSQSPATPKEKSKADPLSPSVVNGGRGSTLPTRSSRSRAKGRAVTNTSHASLLVTKVGDDGNLYYCAICGEFGDVVCCDGCPKVFHPCCIPEGKSRASLNNDDDPWYCPECLTSKEKEKSSKKVENPSEETKVLPEDVPSSTSVRRNITRSTRVKRRKCADCQKPGGKMIPCSHCQSFMHYPSCADQINEDEDIVEDGEDECLKGITHLCTSCRAELVVNMDEEKYAREKKRLESGSKHVDEDAPLLVQRSLAIEADNDHDLSDSHNDVSKTGDNSIFLHEDDLDGEKDEEDNDDEEEEDYLEGKSAKSKRKNKHKSKNSLTCNESLKSSTKKHKRKKEKKEKKRKRHKRSNSFATSNSIIPTTSSTTGKHKKRKIGSSQEEINSQHASEEDEAHQPEEPKTPQQQQQQQNSSLPIQNNSPSPNKRPVKATPPFFFFLADSKYKIEKVLLRKVSIFKSYPRGSMQRNALIAKEGALWWSKLSLEEKLKWQEVSMKDFEDRVIAWKEELVINDMKMDSMDMEDAEDGKCDTEEDVLGDKEVVCSIDAVQNITIESAFVKDEECYLPLHPSAFLNNRATAIISTRKEEDEVNTSYKEGCNPTLLELLQDLRFHPISMIHPHRSKEDFDFPDFTKMTVPYFDVQGPVSTSIGDECLGCTRGWCHFCPVLKRQFPAVEHRAKLQPPLSALMATRIGLGINWKEYYLNNNHPHSMFQDYYNMIQSQQQQNLPLNHPTNRADDIVQFLEEAMAMKLPHAVLSPSSSYRLEPENPSTTSTKKKKNQNINQSQTAITTANENNNVDMIIGGDDGTGIVDANGIISVYKCGRCDTTIHTKLGCIKCRRSLLVTDVSKRPPIDALAASSHLRENTHNNNTNDALENESNPDYLKVQTSMLGRAPFVKNVNGFEKQRMGDVAVASAMTYDQWKPNVILPDKITVKNIAVTAAAATSRSNNLTNDNKSNGFYSSSNVSLKEDNVTSFSKEEGTLSPQHGRHQPTRQQPKRNSTQSSQSQKHEKHNILSPEGCQQMAEIRKEEANRLQKKCLSIAICGILYGLMRRDPLRLFAEPVPLSVDGYHSIVVKAIDFRSMKEKVLDGQYTSLGAFVSDVKLLCANAMSYNPPGSIYWNTAKEILSAVEIMQKRASDWMTAVKNCHNLSFTRMQEDQSFLFSNDNTNAHAKTSTSNKRFSFINHINQHVSNNTDPWAALRKPWPGAAEILEDGEWLRSQIQSGFTRTKENEGAYYGYLALRRAATAAAASLAYPGCKEDVYNLCISRTAEQDEELRSAIDSQVSRLIDPIRLLDEPGWRETLILHILRQVQNRRVEGRVATESGCARCDGNAIIEEANNLVASADEAVNRQRRRRKHEPIVTVPRIASSRLHLTTGFNTISSSVPNNISSSTPNKSCLHQQISADGTSVRGSRIHGWGLFADSAFSEGQIVTEYKGEYVSNPVADAREKMYQQRRIQDYQFRVDHNSVIDATLKGNSARYINHSCSPNCVAEIVPGENPDEHLKRVVIVSSRNIAAMEEITYDYQFPLELNLQERIPCHCGSDMCRGFMNWDLPEKETSHKSRNLRSLVIHGQNEVDFVGRLRHHKN